MKIGYLYYDFLNLYGERGNIKALINALNSLKIKVNVDYLSLNDPLDIDKYDLIYIGSGTEDNQKEALKHLMKYKNEIKKYINNNKFFLITGNAIDMFGKKIITKQDEIEGLNIFDYIVEYTDKRVIKEVYRDSKLINNKIIGFENHEGIINEKSYNDEIVFNNFYGTYTLGPILVRNPMLLKYFVKKMLPKLDINKLNLKLEEKAYKEFVKNYFE